MVHPLLFLTFVGVLYFQCAVASTPSRGSGRSSPAEDRGTVRARDRGEKSSERPDIVGGESSGQGPDQEEKKLIIHMNHGAWVEGIFSRTKSIPSWVLNPVDPGRPPADKYYAFMDAGSLGTFFTENNETSNYKVLDWSDHVPTKVALQLDCGGYRDTFVSNIISELEHPVGTRVPYNSPVGYIFAHIYVVAKRRREVYLFKLSLSQSRMKLYKDEVREDKERRRSNLPPIVRPHRQLFDD